MLSLSHYKATEMSLYANTIDKTPSLSQSSVVQKFTCPGQSCNYIGKTERTLHERTEEHTYPENKSNEQSAIFEHLSTCPYYSHILDLLSVNKHDVNSKKFDIDQIRSNTCP